MKFFASKSELSEAVGVVSKALAKSMSEGLAVLCGIHVKAEEGAVVLETSDLKTSVRRKIPALVEAEGETVIPGKLLSDIVKSMPDAAIEVAEEKGSATIACEQARFEVRTMRAEDYPAFPELAPEREMTLPFETFAKMVKRTAYAAGNDESRAILTGVLIEKKGRTCTMVATDAYRVGQAVADFDGGDGEFSAVVPASFLSEVASLKDAPDEVRIGIGDNQVVFSWEGATFVTRRIEGNYPNWRQLIPSSAETTIMTERTELLQAIKRASLLAATGSLELESGEDSGGLAVSGKSKDVGGAVEVVGADHAGPSVRFGINSRYLRDCLTAFESDVVRFGLNGASKPVVVTSDAERIDTLALIMPIRIA